MAKIVIFGGSFDPVHKAHIQMAEFAAHNIDFKKIVFVIAFNPPHKNKILTLPAARIAMLKAAIKNLDKSEISLYEIEKHRIVYSYQTLDYFQSVYPKDEIFMLIGSDSLNALPTWKKINDIVSKYKFIAVKRGNEKISKQTKYLDRCIIIKEAAADISSTQIRTMLLKGENPGGLLDKEVYKYIKENKLYGYKENS